MKNLFENWRNYLKEGMKQPSDLPDGVQIRIIDDGEDIVFKIISAETGEEPTREEQYKFGRIFGKVWITQWGLHGDLCSRAFEVRKSEAVSGWGPLLYDLAMEYATKNGSGLMSDRQGVSEEAFNVWIRYMNERDDIEKIQLDDLKNTLTPEEEDNCAQLASERWAEKRESKWNWMPTSMLFRKNNTETYDKLKSTGKLYDESSF